jgi:Protein of unknown function (DUF3147)
VKAILNLSAIRRSQWHEYVTRFAFGGTITALAGVIAKQYGPGVGGLFLAFPAIFPAAATLIQKHEKDEKKRAGQKGIVRARMAAGADAAGAAMGSVGLLAFSAIVWRWIARGDVVVVLCLATGAWFTVAFLVWEARDTLGRKLRLFFGNAGKH